MWNTVAASSAYNKVIQLRWAVYLLAPQLRGEDVGDLQRINVLHDAAVLTQPRL